MNTRVAAASVAGGAALFLCGFLVYGLLLEGWISSQMVKYNGLMLESPNFGFLIVANLVWAFFVALIFDRWASITTFVGGVVGGAMISFLVQVYVNLMRLSFMNLFTNLMPAFVDIAAFTLIGAIAGGVIGWVLGFMSKDTAALAA